MEEKVKIIIDTDLGADCDDVGALGVAFALEKRGRCQILAVGHCNLGEEGPQCIEILKNYYHCDFPIGVNDFQEVKHNNTHKFDTLLIEKYRGYIKNTSYENVVSLYRRVLAEQEDQSVVLISIGTLTNLAALARSSKDEISPLSGKELIAKKVKKCVHMMGIIADGSGVTEFNHNQPFPEYNIECDIPSAREFLLQHEKPSYMLDFYDGVEVWTAGALFSHHVVSPITLSYEAYAKGASRSWDLLTVYYAITGELYDTIGPGTWTIDEKGFSYFAKKAGGRDYYLRPNTSKEEIEKTIDDVLLELEGVKRDEQ